VEYNTFDVDGSDILNAGINGSSSSLIVFPSLDAINEVKVLTSNYGAIYGKSASAGGAQNGGDLVNGVACPLNVTSIPIHTIWPYVQQWSLSAQRQLPGSMVASIAYVGSKGTHLVADLQLNQLAPVPAADNPFKIGNPVSVKTCQDFDGNAFPSAGLAAGQPGFVNLEAACYGIPGAAKAFPDPNSLRTFAPGLGEIFGLENVANSHYNAFQATLRRTTGRVNLSLAYTYGSSRDDSSDRFDATLVNSLNLRSNYAPSNFDQRQLLNISYVYDLPSLADLGRILRPFYQADTQLGQPYGASEFMHRLLDDWELSGITSAQTGTPFSVINGGSAVDGISVLDNAGVANGIGVGSYPDLIDFTDRRPPAAGNNSKNFGPILGEPNAFAAPKGLSFGDAGRNLLRNPSRVNFDMALLKNFKLRESTYPGVARRGFQRVQPHAVMIYDPNRGNAASNVITCYGGPHESAGFVGDGSIAWKAAASCIPSPLTAHGPFSRSQAHFLMLPDRQQIFDKSVTKSRAPSRTIYCLAFTCADAGHSRFGQGESAMRSKNKAVNSRSAAGRAEGRPSLPLERPSRLAALTSVALLAVSLLGPATAFGQSSEFEPDPQAGPGQVVVHSKFGGQIFGFDIDQNGSEGLLSESQLLPNGKYLAAVETFSQKTGKILGVEAETQTLDDFVTMGVFGTSVGLVEHEHVQGIYVVSRTFNTLNPLSGNKIDGIWNPPIGKEHIIMPGGVSRTQGVPNVGVFAYDNSGSFIPYVFSSNVAANTFGPVVDITDSFDFGSVPPQLGYDSTTNQAILGGGPGCFGCLPVIGLVDLTNATFTTFTGIGFGFVNGLAVDSDDGVFCTTTEDDAGVEFYSVALQAGIDAEELPGSGGNQYFSGADVEFDPVHKLFLVAQPISSSAPTGSTIYVYDINGNLKETLNGFSFTAVPMHIALHPSARSGYVDGPFGELQSFTY